VADAADLIQLEWREVPTTVRPGTPYPREDRAVHPPMVGLVPKKSAQHEQRARREGCRPQVQRTRVAWLPSRDSNPGQRLQRPSSRFRNLGCPGQFGPASRPCGARDESCCRLILGQPWDYIPAIEPFLESEADAPADAGGAGGTLPRVRWWAIAMNGIEASTSPPPLPRWFGPRASPDDPAVSAMIARVARGAGWADIGGGFNLNLRIDAEPPVVLRVHRPWVRRGRVAGLRRLRERLQRTQVRVARPIRISGCDLLRVADRWAEIEEFIDHVQPRADQDSYVRLFEELGRLHTALKAVWEPSPPEPLDDHRTFGQLRYSVGFTRRRLGPRSEPVVHRMRQLTGELSRLRKEVELPCAPIHGDYKLGNAGELSDGSWATFDLDFARVRERLYDIAASLHHVDRSGELIEPRRLLDAYESTAPEPLTRDEHRWLPGALALIPLHWAATAGLVGDGIHEAESAMTAAEAWWSRRAELSS